MLYIATLASALVGHFMLCYPASVSRGHPPISLFWECSAIYLAFLSPAIAPAFEDFSDSPVIRKTILSVFSVVAAVMTAVPLTNMAGARPRIGHLAGYFGVWRYDCGTIMMKTVVIAAMAVPFVICVELIARSAWASVRQLPSVNGGTTE